MDSSKVSNYVALLRIRQKGARRNALIAAVLFLIALAMLLVMGILGSGGGNDVYVTGAIVIGLAAGAFEAHVRNEVLKQAIELADNLA